jgi:hypothetical protein
MTGVPTRGVAGVATCADAAGPTAEAIAMAEATAERNFILMDS